MKEIILDIPQEYSFLLERYYFEYNRAIQNVVFLLNKHSEEIDFIKNETLRKTYEKAIQCKATLWSYQNAIIDTLLDINKSDKNYKNYVLISENNRFTKLKVTYK